MPIDPIGKYIRNPMKYPYRKKMKLGILVIYLLNENYERLLDIHLDRIEKYTKMPFTIYAATNRLLPQFLPKLKKNKNVKICDIKTTGLRGSYEHSYYLENLADYAIKDGADYIVTLHLDAFPVEYDWDLKLAQKLTGNTVLAAVIRDERIDQKPMTACMFFRSDFYLKYQPRFLVNGKDMASTLFQKYSKCITKPYESGIGFGFKIYEKGLNWYPMLRTNKGGDHYYFSSIHDNIIFHLGSASQKEKSFPGERNISLWKRLRRKVTNKFPSSRYAGIKDKILESPLRKFFPDVESRQKAFENEINQLFCDTENYLHYLKTGSKQL